MQRILPTVQSRLLCGRLHNPPVISGSRRGLSVTHCLCGRKSRKPYDKRFTMTLIGSDVGENKKGGTKALREEIGKRDYMPQRAGYYDKIGNFHRVPEMIPEFIVPDLKGFTLKPYVSYQVPEVTQTEFTSKDLFNACYAKPVIKEYKAGRLKEDVMDTDTLLEQATRKPS